MGLCLIEQDYMTISDFINSLNETDKTKIDIDGDGKVDVSLASLNLTTKNLLSEKGAITEGGKIQLNPDVLKTLSNNIKTSSSY